MKLQPFLSSLACSLCLLTLQAPALAAAPFVALEDARTALEKSSTLVVDIREPEEHATGVAKGVQLLPMRQIGARLSEIPLAADKPVFLICNTQNRSSSTLLALRERGYKHVKFVQGGMSEWKRRGWPMVKP